MKRLSEIPFRNEFIQHFPGDNSGDKSPRQTPCKLYSKALPTPVEKVTLLAWNDELAE